MKKTKKKKAQSPGKMFLRAFFTLVLVLTLIATAGVCVYMLWEDAPDIQGEAPAVVYTQEPVDVQPVSSEDPTPAPTPDENEGSFETGRKDGVYTILLAGRDASSGCTDTLLVCRLDTENHTLNCVSIPRDTYANIAWNSRRINCIYAGTVNSGGVGMDGLREQIKRIIGFDVDCYALVDLDVFVDAIDLMGGVDFDVPCDMNYEDPNQGLTIHLKAGYQHLDGYQAMGVCRFRKGYRNGDLGRIETQHLFLKACAKQFITLGNVPNAGKIIDLLTEKLDTNLTAANMAFFLRQGLKCSADDINFYTMPNTPMNVHSVSYTFINLSDWLNMINSTINPYMEPITENNLDVVYYDGGHLRCTTSMRDPSYLTSEG